MRLASDFDTSRLYHSGYYLCNHVVYSRIMKGIAYSCSVATWGSADLFVSRSAFGCFITIACLLDMCGAIDIVNAIY